MVCRLVFLAAFLFFAQAVHGAPIYQSPLGPFDVEGGLKTSVFSHSKEMSENLTFHLTVYYPAAVGNYANVMFLPGLDGNVPVEAYSEVLSNISSHGVIVAGVLALPTSPAPVNPFIDKLNELVGWMRSDEFNELLAKETGLQVTADPDNLVLMGHSAGCKLVTIMFERGCIGAQGLILLNPVDGLDPWGIIPSYAIHPPYPVNFSTPALILGAGLDPVPGIHLGKLIPACAPAGLNMPRFYDAFRCPKWSFNATDYGHADFLDPPFYELIRVTHFCATNYTIKDMQPYRTFISGISNAMIQGLLQGNCTNFQYFEDESLLPANVGKIELMNDYSSCANDTQKCTQPFCQQISPTTLEIFQD